MKNTASNALNLVVSPGGPPVTDLGAVNAALGAVGAHIAPLDIRAAPGEVRVVLAKPTLTATERSSLMKHFLLPRERLLEVIADSGRAPKIAGGGALETTVASHGSHYPQLYLAEQGVDYSRFDRLHVNSADDGTGVDEIMQFLSGSSVVLHQQAPDGGAMVLSMDCPSPEFGWVLTYDGAIPHIGSLSSATPGSKILMQIIGPPRWSIRYTDGS
jgi:hypothetical protein